MNKQQAGVLADEDKGESKRWLTLAPIYSCGTAPDLHWTFPNPSQFTGALLS